MLFFKKKKLIEIDNKLDLLISKISNDEEIILGVSSRLTELEVRVDSIKDKIEEENRNNCEVICNSIIETKHQVKTEIENLISQLEKISSSLVETKVSVIRELSDAFAESQTKSEKLANSNRDYLTDRVSESLKATRQDIECINSLIKEENAIEKKSQQLMVSELITKLDVLENSLRMLLMNSVMNQIDEV